ncbi:DUF3143 domain-containing protein [Parasynechococcus sp.]|jgi:hypothetical protein|uniref:DUF3143 domain-containing protein n=1 Tax=Parasynechococcus sp. TaxID=3101203 RepID=UPI0037046429
MAELPTAETPLNQHSIRALEAWLTQLGATVVEGNPCLWRLVRANWSADLLLEQEDLVVVWGTEATGEQRCSLPYGLSRKDVEAAINAGP